MRILYESRTVQVIKAPTQIQEKGLIYRDLAITTSLLRTACTAYEFIQAAYSYEHENANCLHLISLKAGRDIT